jgi:hypothetical protein
MIEMRFPLQVYYTNMDSPETAAVTSLERKRRGACLKPIDCVPGSWGLAYPAFSMSVRIVFSSVRMSVFKKCSISTRAVAGPDPSRTR